MRLAILSTMVVALLAVNQRSLSAAEAVKAAEPMNHSPNADTEQRQYIVRCTFTQPQDDQQDKPLAAPAITVREGQPATCSTLSQSPFVTGVRKDTDGTVEPVVTILDEGSTVEVVVTSLGDTQVQIDASYEQSTICDVQQITNPALDEESGTRTTQAPQVCTQTCRIIRSVTLGDTVEVECPAACCKAGKRCQEKCCPSSTAVVKFTVEAVEEDEAAITPIADEETDEAQRVYVVLYQVGDLLEEYAKAKADEELDDSDFIAVIDSVLTDAIVEWGDETAIRPAPENRGLVIAQTRQAHERISQVLREKRDHVADVKKLIRR